MKSQSNWPHTRESVPFLGSMIALCWLSSFSALAPAQPLFTTPAQCQTVYAVHRDGDHSQVLAYNLNQGTLESLAVHQNLNIQALSRHPDTEVLYASTDDTESQLYTVDEKTGALSVVGEIGFDEVVGLAFHPDGSLSGWSAAGLLDIDTETGAGTSIWPISEDEIEWFEKSEFMANTQSIRWDHTGTKLYATANDSTETSTLWVYDSLSGEVHSCDNLPNNVKGLDILPNGQLVYAFDDGEQLGVHFYQPQNCQVVDSATIDTPFNQITSLVWPSDECLFTDPIALQTYRSALEKAGRLPNDFVIGRSPRSSGTRLINISTRAPIQGGIGDIIAGFIVEGSGTQQVLLRGWGLAAGVDPKLTIQKYPSGDLVADNNNWGDSPRAAEIAALPAHLQVSQSTDAGLLLDLPAGAYTVTLNSEGAKGLGLVGVDAIGQGGVTTPIKLINISTRAPIQGGADDIIAGFIIEGTGTQRVLLRGWGLEAGVDPKLTLQSYPSGDLVADNDNWQNGTRVAEIEALPVHLQVSQATDTALLLDLSAGAYTLTLSSVGAKGLGLVGVDAIDGGNDGGGGSDSECDPGATLELSLTNIAAASPNTDYTSNAVKICGFTTGTATATVSGEATLIKNGTDTNSHTTTVNNDDTLAIKARSASTPDEVVTLTLTVGTQSTIWSIKTSASRLRITNVRNASVNADYTSNTITITDVNGSVDAVVTGGLATLIKNGNDTGSNKTQVTNGDTLAIKTRSSGSAGSANNLSLTVGDQSATWTVKTAAIVQPKSVSGQMSGYTAGKFEVNESGGATYAMPITVSPGTAGIQPNLSVAYSSQGSNGLLGLGFSLGGLSIISRCPATRAQDNGLIDPVDFDDNDRFCLDGERLMAVNGEYGADGTTYYTEQNTFRKVVSAGKAGTGPEKFTVWTKSGLIMEYGHSADSRIEAQGKNSVLFWALNKIRDTKGNYLTVFYQEDNANGEYYPTAINYTGNTNTGLAPYNSVQFFYEDRADVVPKYIGGSMLKTSKRLSRIETYEGADIFRSYQLAYQQGAISKRSRLVSVTECGTDGSCFAPTTFAWEEENASLSTPAKWLEKGSAGGFNPYSSNGQHESYVDLNGDGLVDKVWVPNGSHDLWVSLSAKSGFAEPEIWLEKGSAGGKNPYSSGGYYDNYVDLNGDGLADKVWVPYGSNDLWVALSTGSGFDKPTIWLKNGAAGGYPPYSGKGAHESYADLNGDGYTDKVWVPNGSRDLWVALSTGSGFQQPEIWLAKNSAGGYPPYSGNINHNTYVDLNGDGLADKAWIPHGLNDLWVALSTGSGFQTPEKWLEAGSAGGYHPYSSGGYHDRYADLNGDGLADKVWVPYGINDLWVALSTGSGFQTPKRWLAAGFVAGLYPYSYYGQHDSYADLDGDGLADKVWVPHGSDGSLWVAFSTGTGFMSPEKWLKAGFVTGLYPYSRKGYYDNYTDLNGDGLADKVWVPYGSDGSLWVALGNVSQSNLLTSITNGHGATTKLEYKPLTDNSVYTKENDAVYPQVDVQMPLYVVSSYKVTNGVGGENQISYHYTGAKMDLHGRGFRGFSQTTVTNETTGIRTTIFYQRDYRYLSTKIRRIEQRLADGTLISETDHQSELKDYGNGVHFSRIKRRVEKKYEAAGPNKGEQLTTTVTTNRFDDYGNPTQIVVDSGNGYTETTTNTYVNDTSRWILGRLTQAVVTKTSPGQTAVTRTSAFEYDTESGLLTKEIIEPNQATFRLEKTYLHDDYGNIAQSTISGPNIESRTHTTDYDSKGRFVIKSMNAVGHSETKTYSQGNLASHTGPNGLTTRWQYDGFGRPLLETRADDTQTRTAYRVCDTTCPTHAKYFVHTKTAGAASSRIYYDQLDREIRRETVGFDGSAIYMDTQYNARGEKTQVSEPYFAGDTPLWTRYQYDIISRPVKQTVPDNGVTTTSYLGLTTVVTNPLGQTNTRTVNVVGQLVESIDNLNNPITYVYDGFNNLLELRDSAGNVTQMQYNIRGQKTRMYDADTGQTSYVYNALGELTQQTDAKAQTVEMSYDKLGRQVQRQEPEGISRYTYDTQPNGIGKQAAVTGPNGYQESYRYDSFGRLAETHTELNGQRYFISTVYDQYGRVDSMTYPTGLAVQNRYNEHGYLTEVRRASDNQSLWQAKRINARGQLEQAALGNGLVTDKVYTPTTGRIQSIKTGNGVIQNLGYSFDKLGNLTQRTNRHLVETFQYDGLNRLTQAAVTGKSSTTIVYDELGNITFKSDVGSYTYGENGAGPHAVTSINGLKSSQYSYDANGNRTSSSATGQQIEYTSFNKPRRIRQGSTTLEFDYGPNYRRYQQTVSKAGQTTTTTYIGGGLMEREVDQNWVKDTHYLFAGGESIAVHIQKNHGLAEETRYLHKDHLGSIDAITDQDGQLVESLSFDAWGQRRAADNWNTLTDAQLGELILNNTGLTTERGFTGHEHLDEVQLIHMNGRVYDPVIGRFLSADPFVQAPTFSQSLNRYSYTLNNPLSLVDPSGFFFKKFWRGAKKAAKAVGKFVKNYWKPIVATVAGIALGAVTGGLGTLAFGALAGGALAGSTLASITTSVLSGAGFGFGSAFAGTMLGGGSVGDALKAGLKGAVIGGVTAGLSFGVGSTFGSIGSAAAQQVGKAATHIAQAGKIIANGVVSGLSNLAQGGKFEHGFFWSVGTGALNYLYQGLLKYKPTRFGPAKAMEKDYLTLPKEDVNNWGAQGDKYKNHPFREGGPISRFMSTKVPLMNAIAGIHDYMQVQTRKRFPALTKFTNIPYMIPATLITVGAYMGEKQIIPPPGK